MVPGPSGTYFPTLHPDVWFLWCPPPAAAQAALEELAVSRHKRPYLNHIILVPRLFTSQWHCLLHKMADEVFELPAGARLAWPGPCTCMNPSCLVSPCALLLASPSNSDSTLHFWNWSGPCQVCGHTCRGMKGLFCANFATPRLHWSPCWAVWHGRCYTPHPYDHFYYHQVMDDEGFDWCP